MRLRLSSWRPHRRAISSYKAEEKVTMPTAQSQQLSRTCQQPISTPTLAARIGCTAGRSYTDAKIAQV